MKTRCFPILWIAVPSLLCLFLATSAMGAHIITQSYANSGTSDGNLSIIGFDSYQISSTSGYDHTSGVIAAQGGNGLGGNWAAINYVFSVPIAPVGYELTGVNLSAFVIDITPAGTATVFDIYAGLDRTGGVAGTLVLVEPASEGAFADITIPLSALAGGFSIGYATNSASAPAFTTYTESFGNPAFHPSVTLTYTETIPEPLSIMPIGALGLFLLLRRR